jgi:DNA polymerase III sliding clamp (beta) subunit (PCNA family)
MQLSTESMIRVSAVDKGDLVGSFAVSARVLSEALKAVRVCVSKEVTRYYLRGVFFERYLRECRVTAADRHRLASVHLSGADNDPEGGNLGAILPIEAVKDIVRVFGGGKHRGEMSVAVYGQAVTVTRCDGFGLTYLTIDGTYPDWRRVLPWKGDKGETIMAPAKDLRAALKRIVGTTRVAHRAGVVTVETRPGGEFVTLSWLDKTDPYKPERRTLFLPNRDREFGRDVRVGFNALYLLDFLTGAKGDVTLTRPNDSVDGPWQLNREDGATRVLMPCRV